MGNENKSRFWIDGLDVMRWAVIFTKSVKYKFDLFFLFIPNFFLRFFFVLFIFSVIFLSRTVVRATTEETQSKLDQAKNNNVDFVNLKAMGFVEATRNDLMPILKVSLSLNDNQINQIQNLRSLYKSEDKLSSYDFYFAHINEMSADPNRTVDPAKVQNNKTALDEKMEECSKQTQVLKDLMGNKYNEFCLWVRELTMIESEILSNFQTEKNIAVNEMTEKIWSKFQKRDEYQSLQRILNQSSGPKDNFDSSEEKHEMLFKLMVQYEFYIQSPWTNKSQEEKKEFKNKKIQTLKELGVSNL